MKNSENFDANELIKVPLKEEIDKSLFEIVIFGRIFNNKFDAKKIRRL